MTTETLTLITVILGFGGKAIQDHLTWRRSERTAMRRRQYDVEDRERLRKSLTKTMDQQHDVLAQKIDDNTALTALAVDTVVQTKQDSAEFREKWAIVEAMLNKVNGHGDRG